MPEPKIADRDALIKALGAKVLSGELPIAAYERRLFLLIILLTSKSEYPELLGKNYEAAERMFEGFGGREGVKTPEVCRVIAAAFPGLALAEKASARLALQDEETAPAAVVASR